MMTRFIHTIDRIGAVIAGIAVVGLTLAIAAGAVGRYFFNAPIPGVHEIIEVYGLPAAIMLALGSTFRAGGHVRITLLTRRLSSRTATAAAWLAATTSVVVIAALGYGTITRMFRELEAGSTSAGLMMLPLWAGYLIAAVGLVVLLAVVLIDITGIRGGESEFLATEEDLDAGI